MLPVRAERTKHGIGFKVQGIGCEKKAQGLKRGTKGIRLRVEGIKESRHRVPGRGRQAGFYCQVWPWREV